MTKNFFYSLLLSLVNILFPILSFPYASRVLGPSGIGKVQFVISFAQYFALFAALGIPIYGIKEVAKYKDEPKKLSAVFVELSTLYFIASFFLFIVYLIVIFLFPFFENDRSLYVYASILILLSFSYTDWFYSGIEAFRTITVRSVVIKSLSLLFLYLFVRTEGDFRKYLFIIIFSILGNQLFSFFMISRKTGFGFSGLNFRKHLRPLFYIFSATLAASIYTVLDTVLLGFLSNDHAVGLYTASVKLIKITIPFVTSMGVILIPSISKSFAQKNMEEVKKILDKSFNFMIFVSIPVGVGLAILAPEFIIIFSGNQFTQATSSMQILSLLPILIGFGHFFSYQILIPSGKNKEIFFSMLAGVITSLILNFVLVPFLNEIGASIANVITELIVSVSYFFFIKKYYSIGYNWKILLQSIISSIPFIPIVLLMRYTGITMVFTLLASTAFCAVTYIMIQLFIFKNNFLIDFIKPIQSHFRLHKSPGAE